MNAITVTLPATLQSWLEARLADGEYADATDYFRHLVRRDRDAIDRTWLKAMVDEGLASGVLEADAVSVLDDVVAEDPDLRE